MPNSIHELRASKEHLTKICRVLKVFFYILLALYSVCVCAIFALIVLLPSGFSFVGPEQPIAAFSIVVDVAVGFLVLFILGRFCSIVSKGHSPFSSTCSKLLGILGLLIIVSVICKAFIAPGTDFGVVSDSGQAVVDYDGSQADEVFIDVRGILEGISCFVLAVIFRYGALLQNETDDLV
ncbi:MAG: hypothetical protein HFJ66_03365 [Eggerthellaceae bacterium]|nr:hypothetical protein [Eggerthellaceae bacterium]